LKFALVVAILAGFLHAQTLPDAPSAVVHSCTYDVMCDDPYPDASGHKWGDVIPGCWDPRFAGPVTVTDLAAACPADKQKRESWRVLPEPKPRHVDFFTTLPHRSNRQTLTSPWFIVPSMLAIGASAANVTRSRAAGATWGDASAMLPVIGLDYVLDRFVSRPLALVGAGYVVGLRGYGAITRTYK
jgi:hypothetical protein